MKLSGIFGMLVLLGLVVSSIVMGGHVGFFNMPALLIVIGVALSMGLMSFGVKDLLDGISAMLLPFTGSPSLPDPKRTSAVLRGMIVHVYASAAIGTLIGLIQFFRQLHDPSALGIVLSLLLLCIFYAVIIAECFFRPALRRTEDMEKR